MNENICTYAETRDELLIAYLYDEIAPDDRTAFARHLMACALCRSEFEALGSVRADLEQWASPEPAFNVSFQTTPGATPSSKTFLASLQQIPVWAQVAAATLLLGAAASVANLEVTYNAAGLSVRTGWQHAASIQPPVPLPAAVDAGAMSTAPWQADLTALEHKLRVDLDARQAAVVATTQTPAAPDDAVLRRVHALLQESEQHQQRELALRVAEMAREVEGQRQADMVKIDRSLGLIQSRTGMEVMRTQQQVNSLAQRVSQRR
jgi:anti-sigma factor RsiW